MYVVLIGRPGVGKGTQSLRLVDQLGLPRLATGEMLRATIQAAASGGQESMAACIDRGNLAADDVIMELVERCLAEPTYQTGCLFDGIPRTLGQAEALETLLRQRNAKIDVAIELFADVEVLVKRILERGKIENRADDQMEAIERRLEVYASRTAPILEYYRQRGVLESIDGQGSPEEVYDRIRSCLADR